MQENTLPSKSICCFGELLLRFSPEMQGVFIQKNSMPVFVGGAELNAATALALWQQPVKYVTALPDNYLTSEIVDFIQQKNIDATGIKYSGERIGSYYLPQGKDLKNNAVIYDRNYSSFSQLKPGDINWNDVLENVSWFHFSAISPALNENAVAVCKEALKAAASKNITISVDLNYRAKLWQYGKQPVEVMPELAQYCKVIMGNLWSVESLLGIPSPIKESTGQSKEALVQAAGESMLQLHKQYPSATHFAYTFRLDKEYFAVLQEGAQMAVSDQYPIGQVVDKVGSGDCFMGGLIYGIRNQHAPQDTINFSAAAAIAKLQQVGDATTSSITHIQQIIKNNG